VLLAVLWARSYWWADALYGDVSSTKRVLVHSMCGSVMVRVDQPMRWQLRPSPNTQLQWRIGTQYLHPPGVEPLPFRFGGDFSRVAGGIMFPHWFAVVITVILAAAPWMRWRYSLRTLLIAMTLLAALLGAIVLTAR
jgi:hypothetical protein